MPAPLPHRRPAPWLRWLLALAVVLAALGLTPRPALAGIINVPAGASLQAAVNIAEDGDVIRLFGNPLANESVNLSLMGSARGLVPGDLTIVGVNGAASTLFGGNGTRIFYNSAVPFPGTLTLDGFTFSTSAATTGPAVSLRNMGDVFIVNSIFDGVGAENCATGLSGCNALSVTVSAGTPTIALFNNSFSNIASDAVLIDVQGTAAPSVVARANTFTDTTGHPAETNSGFALTSTSSGTTRVTVSESSFSRLEGRAIEIVAGSSASVEAAIVANTISNLSDTSLGAITVNTGADTGSPTLNALVANNTLDSVAANGILSQLRATGAGARLSLQALNNQISNVNTQSTPSAILVEGTPTSVAGGLRQSLYAQIEGNTITNVGGSGVALRVDDVPAAASIRNNSITGAGLFTGVASRDIIIQTGNGNVNPPNSYATNVAVTGNTVGSGGIRFDAVTASTPVNVETTQGRSPDIYVLFNNVFNNGGGVSVSPRGLGSIPLGSVARLPESRPPVANPDGPLMAALRVPAVFDVLANDSDPDLGDTVTLLAVQSVSARGATVTRSGNQTTFASVVSGNGDAFYYVVRDNAGLLSINRVGVDVVTDRTAPDTTITAQPPTPTNDSTPTFSFTGSDDYSAPVNLSFECQLDSGAYAACASPFTAPTLSDGSHTFRVRAKDESGNVDGTPASVTFVVDTAAPSASITSNPPALTASTSARFSFTGSDGGGSGLARFECSLDGGAFDPCTSPVNISGLAEGSLSFRVRAVDNAGNVGLPDSYTWTVDTTAPTVSIAAVSPDPRATPVTSIAITFGEPVAGLDLGDLALNRDGAAIDLAAAGATLSGSGASYTLGNLAGVTGLQGGYTLTLTAAGSGVADLAGNPLTAGASESWTVDTTPALKDQALTLGEEGTVAVALDATDPTGGSLSFTILRGPDAAAGALSGPAPSLSFTGATDHNGATSFRYRACNSQGVCAEATVTLTVSPVNDAPVGPATPPTLAVDEDTARTIGVAGDLGISDAKDTAPPAAPGAEPFPPLQSLTATTPPANGALSAIDPGAGSFVYTPNPDFNGSDSFTVEVCDRGTPAGTSACRTQVVNVVVAALNDAPRFAPGADVTVAEDSGAYSAAWATRISAGPADESGQSVSFVVTANSNPGLFSAQPALSPAGVLSFTPAPNANGDASITVALNDDGGTASGGQDTSAPVTFTIAVTSVPDTPNATITRLDGSPTNAATLRYRASFTEEVSGVDAGDFGLTATGLPGASVAAVTGGPRDYTVSVSSGVGVGKLNLRLLDDDTIVSFDGTPLGGPGANNGAVSAGLGEEYVVDTVPPETTITAGPPAVSAATTATFSFDSTDVGAGIDFAECALDGAAFTTCVSPVSFTGLADGPHTFQVRATDGLGNVDPTPASFSWTVDTGAPNTTIGAGPQDPVNSGDATFEFTGDDGAGSGVAGFECALDGAPFTKCASPASLTGLADGPHTFAVRALDATGNADPTPAAYSWTIDTALLTVTVEQAAGQADPTGAAPVTFVVTFSKPVADFAAAAVDLSGGTAPGPLRAAVSGRGASYTVAVSGMTGGGTIVATVPAGAATDAAGNASQAAASADNSVTFAPTAVVVTGIVRADASPTNAASVRFNVTFSEPVTGVDAADFALAPAGVTGAAIAGVSGSGASYVVTVGSVAGEGTLGLSLRDDDSVRSVASGVALGGAGAGNGDVAGQAYTFDRTAPAAALAPPQPVERGAAIYRFTVVYTDGVAVAGASLGDGDVRVSGPGGYSRLAALAGVSPAGDGGRIAATYTVPAPGGAWDVADNGRYRIALEAGQVRDTAGNSAAAAELGGFEAALGTRLYLPVVARGGAPAPLPDLVVERVGASDGRLQVVVTNRGAAAATSPFWVDAYVGPARAPELVNETWQVVGGGGLVWGVTAGALPLAPGASLTLTAGDGYFRADLSRLSAAAAAGTALYAQVDSANTATSYGAVLEGHERDGGPYNNIARGEVGAGGLRPLAGGATAGAAEDPAPRPAR
jgi:hypothetical protein